MYCLLGRQGGSEPRVQRLEIGSSEKGRDRQRVLGLEERGGLREIEGKQGGGMRGAWGGEFADMYW